VDQAKHRAFGCFGAHGWRQPPFLRPRLTIILCGGQTQAKKTVDACDPAPSVFHHLPNRENKTKLHI